uniref:NADH dehydrogenase subunit 7 n=1 Tax=Sulcionema specki TaxID=2016126 RepID=A0A6G5ZVH6_9EUGL|nr:NADH dehydrogenase subunit 7 [Sulcionema specki]
MTTFLLHFGPAHPAAHGVLRCMLYMRGEWIVSCSIVLGLLHRGTEKLMEYRNSTQAIGYMDRLDYVSPIANECAFVYSIEEALCVTHSGSASTMMSRIYMIEIMRIANHLLNIACHSGDLGCLITLLWLFEDRELLYTVSTSLCGSRVHAYAIIPYATRITLGPSVMHTLVVFITELSTKMETLINVILLHRLWGSRLLGVGTIASTHTSISGVMLRCTGITWDVRVIHNAYRYSSMSMSIVSGTTGDSYDRLLIRIMEVLVSASMVIQITGVLLTMEGVYSVDVSDYTLESLIGSFKQCISCYGHAIGVGLVEAPKGELYVMSSLDGVQLWRIRIRCPDILHLWLLHSIAVGLMLSDVVTLVGTIDVVFGSVDM